MEQKQTKSKQYLCYYGITDVTPNVVKVNVDAVRATLAEPCGDVL